MSFSVRTISYRRYKMAIKNAYLKSVFDGLKARNPNEPEFLQAVEEVLETLTPVIEARPEIQNAGIIERIVEPERLHSRSHNTVFKGMTLMGKPLVTISKGIIRYDEREI